MSNKQKMNFHTKTITSKSKSNRYHKANLTTQEDSADNEEQHEQDSAEIVGKEFANAAVVNVQDHDQDSDPYDLSSSETTDENL